MPFHPDIDVVAPGVDADAILYGQFASRVAVSKKRGYFFRNHLGYSGTETWICRPVPPLTEHITVETELEDRLASEPDPVEKEWIAALIGDLTPLQVVSIKEIEDPVKKPEERRLLQVQASGAEGFINRADYERIDKYYRDGGFQRRGDSAWRWSPVLPDTVVFIDEINATKLASIKLIDTEEEA